MSLRNKVLLLSVETATRECSLAVLKGNEVLAFWRGDLAFSASEQLLIEIQKLLRQVGVTLFELNLLAVIIGPGSFTGLRIGLAIVKGLAAARQLPLIGIPTLQAIAFEENQKDAAVCTILPAGRNNWFAQIFRTSEKKNDEQLQMGELEQLLIKIKAENKLKIVAPREIQENILQFITSNQITGWTLKLPPANIAVCAGKIAYDLFRHDDWSNNSSQLDYGREATTQRPTS